MLVTTPTTTWLCAFRLKFCKITVMCSLLSLTEGSRSSTRRHFTSMRPFFCCDVKGLSVRALMRANMTVSSRVEDKPPGLPCRIN